MFYFAAASYAEMSRRLGVHDRNPRFLGARHPQFARALNELSPEVRQWNDSYASDIATAIAPLNIAGLCDPRRRNWYPVDFDDTIRAAAKLGVSAHQVATLCAQ
jgi:hypothetical protein